MISFTPQNQSKAVSRSELCWLFGAILFGAVLRFSLLNRISVEHFDEGVYASNIWFDADSGYEYPARHLYAPPFLPMAIEWTIIVASMLGAPAYGGVPMFACLVAGLMTIPSIWWIGRKWFGSSAGIVSSWLVASSDFHTSYSRAAMTDVPAALFILWAVYFFWRAFLGNHSKSVVADTRLSSSRALERDWQAILFAAIFTGLAWWTKYNGWLPLAIGLSGGMLWQLLLPSSERQMPRMLIVWLLVSLVAVVIWSPVIWGLQSKGGYASVAANHRQYLVGLGGWFDSARSQIEHIGSYDNWFGWITDFPRQPDQDSTSKAPQQLVRYIRCLVPLLCAVLAAAAICCGFSRSNDRQFRLAVCLLAAWFCGMSMSTPFYYPYPRLVFPWLIAVWLGLGLGVELLRKRSNRSAAGRDSTIRPDWAPSRWDWCLVTLLVVNAGVRSLSGSMLAWQDRTSMNAVARQITEDIRREIGSVSARGGQAIVYVWGEPSLVFHLRAHGLSNVMPVSNLGFVGERQPVPVYLVFGKQAHESASLKDQPSALERCDLIKAFPIQPSSLVLMDSPAPAESAGEDSSGHRVWFYRVQK
jgi:4-amino-4-deoxy-L-arabinose transferase-like glycosyltransferase